MSTQPQTLPPSEELTKGAGSAREAVREFIERPLFGRVILTLILISGVTLGLETSETVMAVAGPFLIGFDRLILAVFVAEILAKIFVYRGAFFRSGWNLFDFAIVAIALMPTAGPLAVLRTLRILRVLRLLSTVPQLRTVVGALFAALPGMGAIVAVLVLFFYVSAVVATKLFGSVFPEWFGTIGASMYSLFQIMTLESWSMGIVRPVMESFPFAWIFFVPFIVITSFAVLNLFIGVIVNSLNNLQAQHDAEEAKAREEDMAELMGEIRALRTEIAQLKTRDSG